MNVLRAFTPLKRDWQKRRAQSSKQQYAGQFLDRSSQCKFRNRRRGVYLDVLLFYNFNSSFRQTLSRFCLPSNWASSDELHSVFLFLQIIHKRLNRLFIGPYQQLTRLTRNSIQSPVIGQMNLRADFMTKFQKKEMKWSRRHWLHSRIYVYCLLLFLGRRIRFCIAIWLDSFTRSILAEYLIIFIQSTEALLLGINLTFISSHPRGLGLFLNHRRVVGEGGRGQTSSWSIYIGNAKYKRIDGLLIDSNGQSWTAHRSDIIWL